MPLSPLITTVSRQQISLTYTDPTSGIRALPNSIASNTTDNGINAAILRYAGARIADPTTKDTSGKFPLVETNLHVRPLLFTSNATLY
jgi:iron transport multicopper oxidase